MGHRTKRSCSHLAAQAAADHGSCRAWIRLDAAYLTNNTRFGKSGDRLGERGGGPRTDRGHHHRCGSGRSRPTSARRRHGRVRRMRRRYSSKAARGSTGSLHMRGLSVQPGPPRGPLRYKPARKQGQPAQVAHAARRAGRGAVRMAPHPPLQAHPSALRPACRRAAWEERRIRG